MLLAKDIVTSKHRR